VLERRYEERGGESVKRNYSLIVCNGVFERERERERKREIERERERERKERENGVGKMESIARMYR